MKIEDKRSYGKVAFDKLNGGDVFVNSLGKVCIKCCHFVDYRNAKYTAFDPAIGSFYLADNTDLVTPLPNARLVIE